MLKKFFLFAGIISALLLIMNIALYGASGFDWRFFVLLVATALLIIYPVYEPKLSLAMVDLTNTVLVLVSIIVFFTFIFAIVVVFYNMPKTEPFEEKVVQTTQTVQQEQDAYRSFRQLAETNKAEIGESVDYIEKIYKSGIFEDDKAFAMLDTIGRSQEKFLNFLAENTFSLPMPYTLQSIQPDYEYMIKSVRAELFNISFLLSQKKYDLATQKYGRLWRIADRLVSAKGQDALGYTINMVLIEDLINFYLTNYKNLSSYKDLEFLTTIKALPKKVNDSYRELCVAQLVGFKNSLADLENEPLADFWEPGFIGGFALFVLGETRMKEWPLFDRYQTVKIIDEYGYKALDLGNKPFYEIKKELNEYGTYAKNITHPPSPFVNIMGYNFLAYLPTFTQFIAKKEEIISKLTAFDYLLSNIDEEKPNLPPIDNLSGRSYQIMLDDKVFRIRTETGKFVLTAEK